MGIKFYDSNGKYWGEYDETRNLFIPFKKRTMRDCYNCKRYEAEGECIECHYEPKDEPTISKMEQVDKDINVRSKDEPQTEEHCENCRHKDECEGATYEYKNTEWWCLAYAPIEDESQTDCAWKNECK